MQARLVAAVARAVMAGDEGHKVNVAAICREQRISRKTFYKWAERYRVGGLAGLGELSRRPHSSPGRLPVEAEDVIVEWRKRLTEEGLDAGPGSIRDQLERAGTAPVPSEATIWRVLVRRGFVVPAPNKRPKSALRRFEAPAPNEWWQIDATAWQLWRGRQVEIINILDDHSRVCVDSRAAARATSELAWDAFCTGARRYGLPAGCLSDNGLIFSGKLRGFEVFFEVKLREAGVRPITSRPYHPQTCGKVERFQQTLKKWLRARRRQLRTVDDLQAALDEFRDYYNHQRPHRGIGRVTPWERFSGTAPVQPPSVCLPRWEHWTAATVTNGFIGVSTDTLIGVGRAYNGKRANVLVAGDHAVVFIDDQLVRELDMHPGYNPTGKGSPRPSIRRHPYPPAPPPALP